MAWRDYIDKKNIGSTVIGGLLLAVILYVFSWLSDHYRTVGETVSPVFSHRISINPWWIPIAYVVINIVVSLPIMFLRRKFRLLGRTNQRVSIGGKMFVPNIASWNALPDRTDPIQADKLPFAFGHLPFRSLACRVTFDNNETRFFHFGIKLIARKKDFQTLSVELARGEDVRVTVVKTYGQRSRVEMHIGKDFMAINNTLILDSHPFGNHVVSFDFNVTCVDGQNLTVLINNDLMFSKPVPMNSLKHAALIAWGAGHHFDVRVDNIVVKQMVESPWLVNNK